MAELVALASQINLDGGVTVDFQASAELGQPMVVLVVSPSAPTKLPRLTQREQEVSALVSAGLSNKQIARKLRISLATTKDHVHRILAKASLPNRASLAVAWSNAPQISLRPIEVPRTATVRRPS